METSHARRTRHVLADGVSPDVARGPRLERRAHGLLRPAGLEAAADVERVDDAVGLLLPGTALGGWASLRRRGNTWFDGRSRGGLRPAPVHCAPGAQLRRRSVVEPWRGLIHAWEIEDVGGVASATPARAVYDEARLAPTLRDAVVALDMATSATHQLPRTTLGDVRRVLGDHWKVRGIVQARQALDLASNRSASPGETWTRLVAILDAGLRGLTVNTPVFDLAGDLLGVADLFDPETGLVIETDGGGHRDEMQHALDNRREEGFERRGCVVCRVSPVDHRDRRALVSRLMGAHRDAQRVSRQDWTTEPPAWWWTWPAARRWHPRDHWE